MMTKELRTLRAKLGLYVGRSNAKGSLTLLGDLVLYAAFLDGAMTLERI